jgi:hypothetical protein
LRGDIGHLIGFDPLFQKTSIINPKTEPFSQEMDLKIPLSSRGLKLSNSKPGCKVSAFNFFANYMPPIAFSHHAQSDKCFFDFQLLIPRFSFVSLLEVLNCHATCRHQKTTIFTSIVCVVNAGRKKYVEVKRTLSEEQGGWPVPGVVVQKELEPNRVHFGYHWAQVRRVTALQQAHFVAHRGHRYDQPENSKNRVALFTFREMTISVTVEKALPTSRSPTTHEVFQLKNLD